MSERRIVLLALIISFLVVVVLIGWGVRGLTDPRNRQFLDWGRGSEATRSVIIVSEKETCPGAPFLLPSEGYIGLHYGDPRGPYSSSAPHQGIDIFSNSMPGETPVYAAYDGYITREDTWRSALIQRIPDDPLQPGRQIWLYYTHMADREGNSFIEAAFPPGTREKFVERGTFLGYTGDYNGNSARSIWVHLHFSIILDDGQGRYLNELDFENTLDPSPYFNMPLNYSCGGGSIGCTTDPACGGD
jgi:murein DD-endopeptidase MepM/ murein hydrolase activator NlpD